MLPIGSVVLLKDGDEKLMITGRKPIVKNHQNENVYMDYMACLYPVGMVNEEMFFFNEEDIETICFKGYKEDAELLSFITEWEKRTPIPKGQINQKFLIE
ncbi:DUF4176 domain-containing protein [Pseudogracilibacillus auburnensis]|uniref:Uncharacterized protein DUF4176 n=1 Tax=Pseudogracilibacillus auburnensis TaxID=1494959 RepID=A0A2V3W4N0_9BACI|nr:DUF4176 domain-containing protein [Pseudogracilibacillus auburnensis]MBO1005987.1 DUF4176 domain-containing protein [Pseudogracilibacillus auburnensis]PXW88134.1 uncharacterized protein DUF4176 [Pseudogracilibacillus auburnensis]